MTQHECILACYALATSGHLEEARENLRRNEPCLKCEEGIDLLARIELALGNEDESRRLWNDAVSSGIGGEISGRALAALDHAGWRHRKTVRVVRICTVVAALVLVGFLLGRMQTRRQDEDLPAKAAIPETPSNIEVLK